MARKEQTYICCLCGKEKKGHGNDPWPLKPMFGNDEKCCNGCNNNVVVPVRIEMVKGK